LHYPIEFTKPGQHSTGNEESVDEVVLNHDMDLSAPTLFLSARALAIGPRRETSTFPERILGPSRKSSKEKLNTT
jgi:hypothetical protein